MSLSDNIERGNIWIEGMSKFERWDLTKVDIAEKLSAMLRNYGNDFVDQLSAQEIVEAPQRFYVMYASAGNAIEIVGMIAVNLSDGEISSLCVASNYRGLGIGTRLVDYALRIIKENSRTRNAIVYVQKGNLIALKLFTSLGFEEFDERKTAKVLRKTLW